MLKMTLYLYTKVSALRNVSGKSWVTIHPAHTETNRNTHLEILSMSWNEEGLKNVPQIMKWCSSIFRSRLYVCCRWERQKDKILITNQKRGRPIRIQGSAVNCPRGLNSSWAFCAGASAHLHNQKNTALRRLSIKTWKNIRSVDSHIFFFIDWTVLEKAGGAGGEEWDSYGSICSFCLFTIHR